MLTNSQEKIALIFSCKNCYYSTSKKSDYNKHVSTAKHRKLSSVNIVNNVANDDFLCPICSKSYSSRVGLWSHKKKCFPAKTAETISKDHVSCANILPSTSIILDLIKENNEFKSLLIEQMKENKEQQTENKDLKNKMVEITQQQMVIPTSVTNNNTTNNNHTFNLNLFLNETCKDAMNIQVFIDNIKITFEDLLTIGNDGFVNGLSEILVKRLLDLEVTKRPIHCTDSKRETIYLKEADTWNKDEKGNKRLKHVIETVENKNYHRLAEWCAENPDSRINNTPNNLLRDKIYLQTLQGDDKTRDKIIKNISKEITVDKYSIL